MKEVSIKDRRQTFLNKLIEEEKRISYMLDELESMDKVISVIYNEKKEERAIFCLLLLLTTKLDLGYVESYYFAYDDTDATLSYKEGYFDLKKITDSDLEEIHGFANEVIDINNVPHINKIINDNNPVCGIKQRDYKTQYEILNRLKNYTIIPICYGKKKYGIIILAGNRKIIRFEKREKEVIDLFKYNLSMYLYNRKLEVKEIENEKLKTIGHFAKSIVHEFKTPVSVIKGLASLAKKKLDNPEKLEQYLDNILIEANRIVEMSQEVSEYANLQDRTDKSETFNVVALLRQSVNHFEKELNILNMRVSIFGEDGHFETGNKDRYLRTIRYLIKNAIENVDYNKKERRLAITAEKDSKRLTIRDNGCGIEKEDISKVCNPFYSTKINGTGLGLTIVKEVLKQYNFSIKIESVKHEFTKITIEPAEG